MRSAEGWMTTDKMIHRKLNESIKHKNPIRDIREIRGCLLSLLKI
jgi:hypothetical protein